MKQSSALEVNSRFDLFVCIFDFVFLSCLFTLRFFRSHFLCHKEEFPAPSCTEPKVLVPSLEEPNTIHYSESDEFSSHRLLHFF